jgi:hypothetical protein
VSDADSDAPASEAAATTDGVEIALGNEFASVVVRRVTTRNGVRLRIESPRSGSAIELDPLELEALTWQTHEFFSQLLGDPHGPAD